MYSVLIAEDELLVRMGLIGSLAWESLGLRIVAESSDGLAALEQYKKWKPDIIFTDIRMPGMDGLTLIREIRKIDNRCEIIVVTCIEDFKVLHAAMDLGISGYLLKATMTQDDISSAVHQAVDNLAGKMGSRAIDSGAMERSIFVEALYDYLIKASLTYEQFRSRCAREQHMNTAPSHLICASVSRKYDDQTLLNQSVQHMISEALEKTDFIPVCAGERLFYLLYENSEEQTTAIVDSLARLQEYISTSFNTQLRICFCRLKKGYQYIPETVLSCTRLLEDRFFCEGALVLTDAENHIINPEFQAWIDMLRSQVWKQGYMLPPARIQYEQIISRLETSIWKSRQEFEDALGVLVMFLGHTFKTFSSEEYQLYLQFVKHASTVSQTITAFNQLVSASGHNGGTHYREIGRVINYMQAHPEEDVSLPKMAAMVNLSPNYFSQLFKDETGLSFTEYLANIRLEFAKALLKSDSTPLQEIVARCGFSDAAYFCKFFKKRTGMSPGKWRKTK